MPKWCATSWKRCSTCTGRVPPIPVGEDAQLTAGDELLELVLHFCEIAFRVFGPRRQHLIATIHYLEALEWQKEIVKVHAVFGGKNPHPNFLVGGMPCSIDLNEANAINAERLALLELVLHFCEIAFRVFGPRRQLLGEEGGRFRVCLEAGNNVDLPSN